MENLLSDVLSKIDEAGASFSEQAYNFIGTEIRPLLMTAFTLYVACYGFQLVTGTASISVSDFTGRVLRLVVILALALSWRNFDALLFSWVNMAPERVGRALLHATLPQVRDPVHALSDVWNTANRAAGTFAAQTGFKDGLPSLIGFLLIAVAGLFVGIALAILLLAKVMLWVLVGTAPIFIACMLFEQTRGYGRGWVNQLLVYVLTPVFVYVVVAFIVIAMTPGLEDIKSNIARKNLMLGDFAGFILLCIAGAIAMVQVQLHAHGIVRGIETGVARALGRGTGRFAVRPAAEEVSWPGVRTDSVRPNPSLAYSDGTERMEAMQNRISANSMPR